MKNNIEKKLKKIFSIILKVKEKKISNIKRANIPNWDSLNHIKIMICIENEFNIKFGAKKFNEVDSYKKKFKPFSEDCLMGRLWCETISNGFWANTCFKKSLTKSQMASKRFRFGRSKRSFCRTKPGGY